MSIKSPNNPEIEKLLKTKSADYEEKLLDAIINQEKDIDIDGKSYEILREKEMTKPKHALATLALLDAEQDENRELRRFAAELRASAEFLLQEETAQKACKCEHPMCGHLEQHAKPALAHNNTNHDISKENSNATEDLKLDPDQLTALLFEQQPIRTTGTQLDLLHMVSENSQNIKKILKRLSNLEKGTKRC